MQNPNWNPILIPIFPWTRSLEKIIQSYHLPNLSGSVIYIVSDYSGNHKSSKYQVISVLYVDLENSVEWEVSRRRIRQQYLSDGRRISFKGLNDRRKQNILIPFLEMADKLRGISVTLVISKAVHNLYLLREDIEVAHKSFNLESKWKYKSLETAMRVTHLISVIVAGLSKPNQNIYWISDEDEMFANAQKVQDMQKMIGKFSAINIKHELKNLGMGTTILDEDDRFAEDLTAMPDLIAGAMSEVATKLAQFSGGRIPNTLAIPFTGRLTPKTDIISSWIWDQNCALQKIVMVIEKHGEKGFTTFRMDMSER